MPCSSIARYDDHPRATAATATTYCVFCYEIDRIGAQAEAHLEDQVPPDYPRAKLAHGAVRVHIRRPCHGDAGRKLGVAQAREDARHTSKEVGQDNLIMQTFRSRFSGLASYRWARRLPGRHAREHKQPCANDAAHT